VRRFFVKALVIIMTLSMVFTATACSSGGGDTPSADTPSSETGDASAGDSSDGELGSYYIAYDLLGSDWILQYMEQRGAWAVKNAGDNQYDYYSADFTADKMESGTQSMISAGIDGLMYYDAFPSLMPTITEMCETAGIPFILHDMPPTEEEKDGLQNSPSFAGFIQSAGYDNGYQLGEAAAADGYKKAVAIGGHVGDPGMDSRIKGFTEAFEKGGGKVLDSARCTSPAEAVQKSGDILTAHPDADVMFSMTGAYTLGTLSSLESQGRKMMIYSIDLDSDLLEYVKKGEMKGNGGAVVATILSAALLQNRLDGHPILDENGKAPWITDIVNIFVDETNAEDFDKLTIQEEPLPEDFYKQFVWRYNNDVTYQDFVDFAKAYSLDYLKELRK
jgi:ribose transport system substrate-binding protein